MLRNQRKQLSKRIYRNYIPQTLKEYFESIRFQQLIQREAAERYKISFRSTIKNKLKDLHDKQVDRSCKSFHLFPHMKIQMKEILICS